jgi:hypothetical protein
MNGFVLIERWASPFKIIRGVRVKHIINLRQSISSGIFQLFDFVLKKFICLKEKK